jgi:hypothetical protein
LLAGGLLMSAQYNSELNVDNLKLVNEICPHRVKAVAPSNQVEESNQREENKTDPIPMSQSPLVDLILDVRIFLQKFIIYRKSIQILLSDLLQ